MGPRLRKLALTAHVTFSVGWLGAVLAYLALAIAGLNAEDARQLHATYPAMAMIARSVIVPCSLAAPLSGLVLALGTPWGLLRHYWVAAKFALTVPATAILLVHMRAVDRASALVQTGASIEDLGMLRLQLAVHAAAGLAVLLVATLLSIFKPWGRTPFARP